MNFFKAFITGNLVDDATTTNYEDRTVHNFTVASNISKSTKNMVQYINCAFWTKKKEAPAKPKEKEEPAKTIGDYLKKGKGVSLICSSVKITQSENDDQTKSYQNVTFTISDIDFH